EGADPFHPKVVQASMGSIFRVQCLCVQPDEILKKLPSVASYACVLDGKDVHTFGKIQEGIVILGNESKGIQSSLIKQSTYRISIPRKGHAESLNAAVAAGIISDVLL
ncbi:MAG TPA: TrmH family RNA methyltransferase, partial [Chitinophagaceae bacterium]|nr:TrmH family RNA methyltransferase [Chitinophagaceae bacterium]